MKKSRIALDLSDTLCFIGVSMAARGIFELNPHLLWLFCGTILFLAGARIGR